MFQVSLGIPASRIGVRAGRSPGNQITTFSSDGTVWRRDADGEWHCVVDIWNDLSTAVKQS
jgi:ketosteroid isomerase-like protein